MRGTGENLGGTQPFKLGVWIIHDTAQLQL